MTEPRVSDEQLRAWSERAAALAEVHHALAGPDSKEERFLNLALDLRDARERITALESERDEARARVRNHHLEACESCAATESERDRLLAECRAWREARDVLEREGMGSAWTVVVVAACHLRAANEAREGS